MGILPAVWRKKFMVGQYEVVAQPMSHSAHMLRYTVYLRGTRIGALVSMPSESDCRFLENPPAVPPLKLYSVIYRPGRPKNGAKPPAATAAAPSPLPRDELTHSVSLPDADSRDDS